jgi:photosystem II stability/assembly factor-like uncharacterized protein
MRSKSVLTLVLGALLAACTPRQLPPVPTEPKPDPVPVVFHKLQMVSETAGWAEDDGLLRTRDGGRTWNYVLPLGPRNAWTALNETHAWAASQSSNEQNILIHRTTEGGKNRETASIPLPDSLAGAAPVSISFADATNGWLMVESMRTMNAHPGYLFATADGGKSWALVSSTADSLPVGGAVKRKPGAAAEGWLVGSQVSTVPGKLYRTTDGGRTWEQQELKLPPNRLEPGQLDPGLPVFSPDGQGGLLAATWVPESGAAAAYATLLFRTTDGGVTWQHQRAYLPPAVIASYNAAKAWAWQGIPREPGTTGPVTAFWDLQSAPWTTGEVFEPDNTLVTALEDGWNITDLQFVTEQAGWALLRKLGQTPQLLQTKDGARSWSKVESTK